MKRKLLATSCSCGSAGIDFGFADEIEAAIRSAVGPKTYEEEVKGIRKDIERFREVAPVAAYGTEIGASALLPFGVARAGAVGARAAQQAAARPIAASIGTGAAYGAGAAEGDITESKGGCCWWCNWWCYWWCCISCFTSCWRRSKTHDFSWCAVNAGQAMGGLPRAFESTATALPFAGGLVEAAQKRATAEFSRTAVEDALKPLGLKLEKGVTGSDAVKQAFNKIDSAYDNLTPRLKIKDADAMRETVTQSIQDFNKAKSRLV